MTPTRSQRVRPRGIPTGPSDPFLLSSRGGSRGQDVQILVGYLGEVPNETRRRAETATAGRQSRSRGVVVRQVSPFDLCVADAG